MAETYDVVVVGAGISGAATAYYLKKAGIEKIALVERDTAGSGGTGKSAAIVRQHYSTPLMVRVALDSVQIFQQLSDELGSDVGYRPSGYLFIPSPEAFDVAEKSVEMQRGLGVDTCLLTPGELAQRYEWLNTEGLLGGAFERLGGFADPIRSVEAYIEAFKRLGGVYHQRCACRGLSRDGDAITGVVTDAGTISAGLVVNASGPWARFLAASAEIDLKMRTVREQDTVWECRDGRPLPNLSVSAGCDAFYLRPLGDRRYVVGLGFPKEYDDVDPYNFKVTADDNFISDVSCRFERRIPTMAGARLVDSYASLYDVSADWYPYVGPRSDITGYSDFSGGSGHGFKIAPALAKGLADWIVSNHAPSQEFAQLSYDRVSQNQLIQRSYGGNRG